jgi:hypothetical protein
MKTLAHNALKHVLMVVFFLLNKTAPDNLKKVCLVCNYPNGGNSVCSEACKMKHMERERYTQSLAFWRELEANPESKLSYMEMMKCDEADYQKRKMGYLG